MVSATDQWRVSPLRHACFGLACVCFALVVAGVFANNTATEYAGAVFVTEHASVTVESCSFMYNTAQLSGGALVTDMYAQLTIKLCLVANNTSELDGGGVCLSKQSSATLINSILMHNRANADGGGVSLWENSTVKLMNSSIAHNKAAVNGGGLAAKDASKFRISGATKFANNTAGQFGDGLFVATENSCVAAREPLGQKPVFTVAKFTINQTSAPNFVSRLSSNEGLLPVELNVSGLCGLPCEGVAVAAMLNTTPIQVGTSNSSGEVSMNLKLVEPPGQYDITFRVFDAIVPVAEPPPFAALTVFIVNCSVGDVTIHSGNMFACQTCPKGSYSLDPRNYSCDDCVPHAECPGGPAIVALRGSWHSSKYSPQVHK